MSKREVVRETRPTKQGGPTHIPGMQCKYAKQMAVFKMPGRNTGTEGKKRTGYRGLFDSAFFQEERKSLSKRASITPSRSHLGGAVS